jgi:hypothetical protein
MRSDEEVERALMSDEKLMASIKYSLEHPESHKRRERSNRERVPLTPDLG